VKTVLLAALVIGAIAGGLKLLVGRLEPRAAFFPMRGEQANPGDAGIRFERVVVNTEDGERLSAWWIPGPPGAPEVLFFHGNGGNLSVWGDAVIGIAGQGWSVFALDYRGYGLSTGQPTETGLYKDADAALAEFWTHRHHASAPVLYWGRSLGATVAAYAASQRAPHALVLESPFYSARTLVREGGLGWLPALLMSYRFETAEFAANFRGPTLVVHGDRDSIVPLSHGRRVFQELRGPKKMVVVEGADHNDLHLVRPGVYWETFREFVQETVE
jgi:fermentation-respiration switch protein FrsA (DUF1100 family)